ncbi:MAG: hypothetical protein U9R01_03460, partial [candidate division WOR-3 bacterium]|nr:hypothetical protein [candidate division WOR-3 bacterium]
MSRKIIGTVNSTRPALVGHSGRLPFPLTIARLGGNRQERYIKIIEKRGRQTQRPFLSGSVLLSVLLH